MSRLSGQSPCTRTTAFFRDQKYSTRPAGQVRSIFLRSKVSPATSIEPGCQVLSATGPNARGPDSSNLTADQKLPPIHSDPQKMQLQVAFSIHSTLAWSQILFVSQIFDPACPGLTMTDLSRKGSRPLTPHMSTCQLSLFKSQSILGSAFLASSSSLLSTISSEKGPLLSENYDS